MAAGLFVRLSPPWRLLRSAPISQAAHSGDVAFHAVGRSATVILLDEGNKWLLRTNGLPESSIGAQLSQKGKFAGAHWLGVLGSLLRPETREMLVIGLGGGVAIERVHPTVERIDVIELEPEVIEANRFLSAKRRYDPLADPRVHLHVNDARGALELTDRRYGAIVSQPSHPWTSGASHLYTREFFRLARAHLEPGGVLVQWMGAQYVDETLLRSLLATLLDTFPHVQVYAPYLSGEFIFAASDEPFDGAQSSARAIAAAPALFAEFGLNRPEDVAAAMILDAEGVRKFAASGAVSTDDRNLLQTQSVRVVLAGRSLDVVTLAAALGRNDALYANASRFDPIELSRSVLAQMGYARVASLAGTLEPGARLAVAGLIDAASEKAASAGQKLEAALQQMPGQPSVRAALLRLRAASIDRAPGALDRLLPLVDPEQTLVDAWLLARREGDAAVERMEDALARVPLAHPLGADALRLRARWRVATGGREPAIAALDLVDNAFVADPRSADALLRARAALAAGSPPEAVASLRDILPTIESDSLPGTRSLAAEMLAFVDTLDATQIDGAPKVRARLERFLSGRRPAGARPLGARAPGADG